jgi:hypothetical protein
MFYLEICIRIHYETAIESPRTEGQCVVFIL